MSEGREAAWTRRAALAAGGIVAAGAAGAVGVLALRDGGALVRGRGRARAVVSDDVLPERVDVVIIGGGNIGCMTALTLAERGVRVALCEKGVIAGEASGRSLGSIDSVLLDPVKASIVARSKQLWEGMNARLGAETGYRKDGFAALFSSSEFLGMAEGWVQSVAGAPGMDARMISAAEAAAIATGSYDTFAGGVIQPSDAQAEPQLFAPAVADAIRRAGGVVLQNCAVRGVETAAGRVSGVVTERGAIACSTVVLAGGAWSAIFARSLGLDLPQLTGFSGVTRLAAPSAPGPAPCLLSEQRGVVMRRTLDGAYDTCIAVASAPITPSTIAQLPRLWPAMQNLGSQIRPVLNVSTFMDDLRIPKRWALDQPSPFEQRRVLQPEVRQGFAAEAVAATQAGFPQLAASRVLESWSGALTTTIDNMPVISKVDALPGLIVGAGFYFGLTMAPGAGEALADLVTDQAPQFDLSLYRFARFSDGSDIVFRF